MNIREILRMLSRWTRGGLLWQRRWRFAFHSWVFWLAKIPLASRRTLSRGRHSCVVTGKFLYRSRWVEKNSANFFLGSLSFSTQIAEYNNNNNNNNNRLYGPGWALASSRCHQRPLSWPSARQYLQASFLASSSTPSIHLDFGRLRPRWPPELVHSIFSGKHKWRNVSYQATTTSFPILSSSFFTDHRTFRGSGSVVGISTGYGLDGPWIESLSGRDFPHLPRPVLGPTQPPVQWVPGLSRG